jgi:hypothetical protein
MALVAPRGRKHLSADALFRTVRSGFAAIPDYRLSDTEISLTDALMSAFALFSLKSRLPRIGASAVQKHLWPTPARQGAGIDAVPG